MYDQIYTEAEEAHHEKRTSRCRSCQRMIVWLKTVNGKNIPIDFDTCPVDHPDEFDAKDRGELVCHWETCPDADKHRRRSTPQSRQRGAYARNH
jgi:hypothetical protein